MVILALIGVGLTMANSAIAATYWILMVPIYGLLCVATAWYRSVPGAGAGPSSLVLRQVFHWLGIGGALGLDFFVRSLGEETDIAAGLNALLLLALGCYLAGVHLERLFIVVGLLLTLTFFVVAKVQEYLWLVLVTGAVAIMAIIGLNRVLGRVRSHSSGS
ncbi:MAG: hypothetical protein ACHBNF_07135 [Chromatiales bacterium]